MDENSKKKILIADPSSITLREIFKSPESSNYNIETVSSGPECIEKIESFRPDLIFVELLLPQMHGIEILKFLKTDPSYQNIGVILTSSLRMQQNYNAAIEFGASYYLQKPYSYHEFFHLIHRFFDGHLTPDPFNGNIPHFEGSNCFNPVLSTTSSYIKFWGTRGSSPVSGARYLHYGGNTCCLEIKDQDHLVILDAGSGIRELGEHLHHRAGKKITILLSHTHWDHVIGFPFFSPVYHRDEEIDIYSPIGYQKEAESLFHDMLSVGYFPIRLEEMQAKMNFKELRDSSLYTFGSIQIACHYANHPGPTLCFKIITPKKIIGYVTDNELLIGYHGSPQNIGKDHFLLDQHLALLDFLSDCHTVIHEAQYFPQEYYFKAGWGHSSISNAVAFIKHLKHCEEWIVTHHDPKHSDEDLMKKAQMHRDILNECNVNLHFTMAFDGMIYPI